MYVNLQVTAMPSAPRKRCVSDLRHIASKKTARFVDQLAEQDDQDGIGK